MHIGNIMCDTVKLLETVNRIRNDVNGYYIVGGDALDIAIKDSIGDVYNGMNPGEEAKKYMQIFDGLWDRCLTVIRGNHEFRLIRSTGIDLLEFITPPEIYSFDNAILHIKWGNELQYKTVMLVTHGTGGATTPGGQMNSAIKMDKVLTNIDFVLSGHTHQLIYYPDLIFIYNSDNMCIEEHITQHVVCGGYLRWGEYSERKALKPSIVGSPILEFCNGKIYVRLV